MKKLSFLLAIFMLFSLISPLDANAKKSAEKVDITSYIEKAREVFAISKDYDEVSSNIDEYSINIGWRMKNDYDKGEDVTFDYNKNIIYYSKRSEHKRFSRTLISENSAKETANNLVKKMYPEKDVRFEELEILNTNYIFKYRLYINDVRAYNSVSIISIDKETGLLKRVDTTLEFQGFLRKNPKVDVKEIKSNDEAFKKIEENFPSRLDLIRFRNEKYIPYYTWQYALVVDAKTLSPVDMTDYDIGTHNGEAKEESGKGVDSSVLTETESLERDKIKNLKSKSEAVKKAIKLFKIPKEKHSEVSLIPLQDSGFYSYRIQFKNKNKTKDFYKAYVELKADDLMPLNFSIHESVEKKALNKKNMGSVIKKISKELPFFDEYKEEKPMFDKSDKEECNRIYLRKLGKYTVPDDYISFGFKNNRFSYYYLSRIWDNIDYEESKIDKNTALKNLVDKLGLNLYVMPVFDNNIREKINDTRLVYAVEGRNYNRVRATDGFVGYDETKILNVPRGEIKDSLVKDAVISGFGVVGDKALTDKITYKDLLFNLTKIYGSYDDNLNLLIKEYEDLKIFDKSKLENSVKLEVVAKAFILKKLGLTPEDIKSDVFVNTVKADEKSYPALLIMLTDSFKDKDFTKDATVLDMLEFIAKIVF